MLITTNYSNFGKITDDALKFLLIVCGNIEKIDTTVKIYAGFLKTEETLTIDNDTETTAFDIFGQLCDRSLVRIEHINNYYYSVYLTEKGVEHIDMWKVLVEI